jgi:hypothetical protein
LRVLGEEHRLQIKRIHGVSLSYCTTILAVIFGWIAQ